MNIPSARLVYKKVVGPKPDQPDRLLMAMEHEIGGLKMAWEVIS